MHGSKKKFQRGGSNGYLRLPGGSEAYFWWFYYINLKKFNFAPPPFPLQSVHVYCQYPVPKGACYHKYAFNMDIFST